MAAAAASIVSSTRFLRFACDHELFRAEYQRSNRRRGTKILRCFPHCCPEHKPRCYCGCSLQIAVAFCSAAAASADDIAVYARFEPVDDPSSPPYRCGDVVPLPVRSCSEDAWAEWMRATREGAVKQAQMSQNTVLYVLNNNRFPRWFYGYDSGAKKTQRTRKHVLKVYVCRLESPSSDRGRVSVRVLATVLATAASTAFTLVSYRRARQSSGQRHQQTTEADESATEGDADDNEEQNSAQDTTAIDDSASVEEKPCVVPRLTPPLLAPSNSSSSALSPQRQQEPPQDTVIVWLSRHRDSLERLQQLCLLEAVVDLIRPSGGDHAELLGLIARVVAPVLERHCAQPQRRQRLLTTIISSSSSPSADHVSRCPPTLETLLRVFADTVMMEIRRLQCLNQRAMQESSALPSVRTSRQSFLAMIDAKYAAVAAAVAQCRRQVAEERFSRTNSAANAMAAFIDETLAMVYASRRWHKGLSRVRTVLDDPITLGAHRFRAWVADIRDTEISAWLFRRHNQSLPHSDEQQQQQQQTHQQSGKWVLNLSSLELETLNADGTVRSLVATPALTLSRLQFVLMEAMAIEINVYGDQEIHMRSLVTTEVEDESKSESEAAPLGRRALCMRVCLDGSLRVFRVLPSGTSVLNDALTGFTCGDYRARVIHSFREWQLEFFAWRSIMSNAGIELRHVSLRVARHTVYDGSRVLRVDGDVGRSEMWSQELDAEALLTLPTCDRLELYSSLGWRRVTRIRCSYHEL